MKQKIKFEDTVYIFDSAFYNFIVTDIKKHFESVLDRQFNPIELSDFITYLALDLGMTESNQVSQVIWLHDKETSKLMFSQPNNFKNDLDGKAFRNEIGEFLMASVSTENLVPLDQLFLEVLQMTLESDVVKRIALIGDYNSYGKEIFNLLDAETLKKKEVVLFNMGDVNMKEGVRGEILAYPLMQALGIRADDLNE